MSFSSKATSVHDHSSMADRHDNRVTLEECIEGFSKLYVSLESCLDRVAMVIRTYTSSATCSELLGNDNPWNCPQCKENRLAQRTLSVQALPNTLIIQLKRWGVQ